MPNLSLGVGRKAERVTKLSESTSLESKSVFAGAEDGELVNVNERPKIMARARGYRVSKPGNAKSAVALKSH
jgi:predicted KAP-like P-loop ATPase